MKSWTGILFSAFILFSSFVQCGYTKESDPRDTDSPFGMHTLLAWNHEWNHFHYSTFEEVKHSIDLMKEAGVGMVRLDFAWNELEPINRGFIFSL